ncbi:hypothetical protein Tco_0037828 [Tanacetum coccineum]
MIAKDGTVSKFLGKFPGYTPSKEKEEEPEKKGPKEAPRKGTNYEFLSYAVSDSDSDLESTEGVDPTVMSWKSLMRVKFDLIHDYLSRPKDSWHAIPKSDGKGGAIALTRWIEKMESVIDNSGCAENQRVKFAASSFVNKALTWWNTQVQARGREAAIGMSWVDFKALLLEELCPSNEMDKWKMSSGIIRWWEPIY